MKKQFSLLVVLLAFTLAGFAQEKFSFAFFTDIHLNKNPKARSYDGLRQAIRSVDASGADFVLTGGDNVDVDGMKANQRADAIQLYQDYKGLAASSALPWYFTIGNHDRYWGDGDKGGVYGEAMFSSFFGETYYTFDHKGWRFIILNSTEVCDGNYCISDAQYQWLEDVLDNTPANQPIIVSTHVPFLSLYYPVLEGRYTSTDTFGNQKQVFDRFARHNLKLVLQGHQHLYEEIKVKGVQFITGGAVSANWWHGTFHGTEEGYLKVNLYGDEFDWEYIDYGWEVPASNSDK
ncbi:metallophosphoesterase family protein [Parapedobacter soli]|uniref:metallophosphoesterase family protein n=1 Tax=Parapedobacter soli TaxID=416955 RepID=UPI0021C8A0E2|nr:metallophosphoesterase [Parapedobacter soli]